MKRCLPLRKSKDSSRVSASVQRRPLLALNSTAKSKPSCGSCLRSWPTGLSLTSYMCSNVQLRRFTPTNAPKIKSANYLHLQTAVTQDMSAIPQEKLKEHIKQLLSKYKIKY